MDQRVVYNLDLPEAGPEQINNIRQQRLVRNRQRAVEQREQRWEQRAAAVVQGQVGGGRLQAVRFRALSHLQP